MSWLRRLDLPPVWAALAAALAWGLARLVPVPRLDLGLWPPVLLAALGFGLILWAAALFLSRGTPIEPGRTPRALLAAGPFRLNRNPIYTGMALILLAWALHLGALAALLPVLAWPVLITRRFIRAEEAALREAFGPEAEAFLDRTRRW
ncbi:MAG: methyltransferase family protein [Pseudomonadota bacterium]